eukprot:gene1685-1047_t
MVVYESPAKIIETKIRYLVCHNPQRNHNNYTAVLSDNKILLIIFHASEFIIIIGEGFLCCLIIILLYNNYFIDIFNLFSINDDN